MPIPQELSFLVGWASCPSNKFMKRTFARGIITIVNCFVKKSNAGYIILDFRFQILDFT